MIFTSSAQPPHFPTPTSTNDDRHLSEERIQADFFQYINGHFPQTRKCLFHVPNGGSRNEIEGNRFKAQGVVAGTQDIFFFWNFRVYIIEFKDATGVCSPEQKETHAAHAVQGFTTWIFRTSSDAISFIVEILEGRGTQSYTGFISPYSKPELYPALKAEASQARLKKLKK